MNLVDHHLNGLVCWINVLNLYFGSLFSVSDTWSRFWLSIPPTSCFLPSFQNSLYLWPVFQTLQKRLCHLYFYQRPWWFLDNVHEWRCFRHSWATLTTHVSLTSCHDSCPVSGTWPWCLVCSWSQCSGIWLGCTRLLWKSGELPHWQDWKRSSKWRYPFWRSRASWTGCSLRTVDNQEWTFCSFG